MGLLGNKTIKKVHLDFAIIRKENPNSYQKQEKNLSMSVPVFCTNYLQAYFANEATVVDHNNTYYLKNML